MKTINLIVAIISIATSAYCASYYDTTIVSTTTQKATKYFSGDIKVYNTKANASPEFEISGGSITKVNSITANSANITSATIGSSSFTGNISAANITATYGILASSATFSSAIVFPSTGITGAGTGSGLDADKLDGHEWAEISAGFTNVYNSTNTLNTNKASLSGATFTGNIAAPNVTATYGVLSATANITNLLTAKDLTVTYGINTATAVLTGALTGTSATLTGNVSAPNLTATYGISAATATLTGAFSVGGSTMVVSNGNVGISSSTPMGLLTVGAGPTPALRVNSNGTSAFSNGTNTINILDGNKFEISQGDAYFETLGQAGSVKLRVYQVEEFTVTKDYVSILNNNVGISSSTPQGLLVVGAGSEPEIYAKTDEVRIGGTLSIDDLSGANVTSMYVNSGNSFIRSVGPMYLDFGAGTSFAIRDNTTARLNIDSSGNVGISSSTPQGLLVVGSGSNPSFRVDAGGGVYPKSGAGLPTTGYNEGSFFYNTADHSLYISTEAVSGAFSWKAVW